MKISQNNVKSGRSRFNTGANLVGVDDSADDDVLFVIVVVVDDGDDKHVANLEFALKDSSMYT